MIDWKEITLADKSRIESRICASGCHGADYSFTNLYIWRDTYKPYIAYCDQRLLVGMPDSNVYAYPKGDGDIEDSIELLLEEAHERGHKLVLRGLTDRTLREFMSVYPDSFEISGDRDNADYIYSIDRLCELPGRHLSSKRNHIRHFERNGEWEFCPISGKSSLAEAETFVEEFYKEKDDPELTDEARAIDEMFENYELLGFLGGLLYQNGRSVAFTAGTKLDDEVFDTHFEKAMPGVEGAYTMVNREFARLIKSEYPDIRYINREEDMGLEGLRKAKESYHPDILLMKYFAKEK